MPIKRLTVPELMARKHTLPRKPIVCLTAHSTHMARLIDPHVDLLLVGDSLGMVAYGMDNTLGVSLDMMIAHGQAVMRGSERALVVIDMPFGSYEESPEVAFRNAARVVKQSGCQAVKIEGGARHMADTIEYLNARGIPVMAHIGLMPQSVNVMGGYKTQGYMKDRWGAFEADAKAVAEAGAFCVVLEGMVAPLADRITAQIGIPTIGIGASVQCDGQILVSEDMLGMSSKPARFVKEFAKLDTQISAAVAAYAQEVRMRLFPDARHIYCATETENAACRMTKSPQRAHDISKNPARKPIQGQGGVDE